MKLFNGEPVSQLGKNRDEVIKQYVLTINRLDLLEADTEQLALLIAAKYKLGIDLVLYENEKSVDIRMVSAPYNPLPLHQKRMEIKSLSRYAVVDYTIPWSGTLACWTYTPRNHFREPIHATIEKDNILFSIQTFSGKIQLEEATEKEITQVAQEHIHKIRQTIENINEECMHYNAGMLVSCKELIEERKAEINQKIPEKGVNFYT